MIIKAYEVGKKNLHLNNFFLFYGENIGLKKDLTKFILQKKEEKNGKYKKLEFDEEEIIKNESSFYNLIFSGSLFDEKKAIFINKATDKLFNLTHEVLQKNIDDVLLFLKSDQLEKKSKIRNLFEKDKNFFCIACYKDSNFDLIKIINNEIKKSKIKLSTESINLLVERANGDRGNLRNEINKLSSFAHNKYEITYEQIKELTNMSGNYQNDYIVNLCLNGDKKKLNKTLKENDFILEDFFILLKIFSNKIHRLLKIKMLSHSENSIDKVFSQIRPPIFWKEKDDVKKQVKLWNEIKLSETINKINKIELSCKKNNEIAINIMLDFLSTVCQEVNS